MLTRRQTLTALIAAPAVLTLARPAFAGQAHFYMEGGVAIDGTDPTSYFTAGAPVAGDDAYSLKWQGAIWRFASAEAQDMFEMNPDRFAPQYGGYCAWAVAEGYTAPTVPEAWRIEDGRLYLNFSRRIQRRWERDIPGNIARGDANWPRVLSS
ncbi:YHS domain-containing (seleno)protein [Aestuariibius insulae]|uniref:YHS domain-containing (seleno)protein n=1 Tax=Aestuariibius insulae TaxID=2058287 RepID=UPI00345F1002